MVPHLIYPPGVLNQEYAPLELKIVMSVNCLYYTSDVAYDKGGCGLGNNLNIGKKEWYRM